MKKVKRSGGSHTQIGLVLRLHMSVNDVVGMLQVCFAEGLIERSGSGVKGDPFRYSVKEVLSHE